MHIDEYCKKERNKEEEKKLPTLVTIYIFNNGIMTVNNLRQHCSAKYKPSVQKGKHCPARSVSNEQCSGYNKYTIIKRLYPCSSCNNLTSVHIIHTVNCIMLHYTLVIHVLILTSQMNFYFLSFIISLCCF